jgi:hypothetical protein
VCLKAGSNTGAPAAAPQDKQLKPVTNVIHCSSTARKEVCLEAGSNTQAPAAAQQDKQLKTCYKLDFLQQHS